MSDKRAQGPFSWQTFLFVVLISLLFIYFLVAWYGDAEKRVLVETFRDIFLIESVIFGVVFVLGWLKRDLLPFGAFPRDVNLGFAVLLGFGGALGLIGLSYVISKGLGGMAVITLPDFWVEISNLFRALPIPKLFFKPFILDWVSGVQAIFWQMLVSGVEEMMNVAFTLALALVFFTVIRHWRGQVSTLQKRLILTGSMLIVGLFWTLLHGLQNYHYLSEFVSAFAARLIMGFVTFATGSVLPAFLMHWLFNVLAPAVTAILLPSAFLFALWLLIK